MLDSKGFDDWAEDYDKSVELSNAKDAYPFAGYNDVLKTIYRDVIKNKFGDILDIGFGTAVLTKKLYDRGFKIFGIDFSEKMIKCAEEKMPNAELIKADFTKGYPSALNEKKFDFIISTYALHHLNDDEKINFIRTLCGHLKDNGKLLIGDVAFNKKEELVNERERFAKIWDSDEYYIVFEDLMNKLNINGFSFLKISRCAGIISYKNEKKAAE